MRTFAKSLIAGLLIVVITFLSTLVLSKFLKYEEFSQYMFMISAINILGVFVKLGIPSFSLRETARYEGAAHYDKIVSIWKWSVLVIIVNSVIVLVPSFFVLRYVLDYSAGSIEFFLLAIPFLGLVEFLGFTLRGMKYISTGQLVASAFSNFLNISMLIVFGVLYELSLNDAILIYVLSSILSSFIAMLLLRNKASHIFQKALVADFENGIWFKSILTLGAISAIQVFNKNVDIIIIGAMGHVDYVGVYKVAIQMSILTSFILGISNNITAFYVSKMYFSERYEEMQSILSLNILAITAVSVTILSIILIFGEEIILFLYGETFERAVLPFMILSIGQFTSAIFGPVGMILNMTGHEKRAIRVTFPAMLLNLLFLMLMIFLFGPIVAAFVNVAFMLGLNFMLLMLNRKLVEVDPSIFFALKTLCLPGERREALFRMITLIVRSKTL